MTVRTHLEADQRLLGRPISLGRGTAEVELLLLPEMRVDTLGLVHGGFVFGAADYAAMLAVNDPLVVLVAAEVRFLKPSAVGDALLFRAQVDSPDARRPRVTVSATDRSGRQVFQGTFSSAVLSRHVLAAREN